jgi:hypothetical protein
LVPRQDRRRKRPGAREALFDAQVEWRKIFPKAEPWLGSVNEDCYKVVLTPMTGKPETRFYSKKSGLLLKTTTTAVSPMGEVAVEVGILGLQEFRQHPVSDPLQIENGRATNGYVDHRVSFDQPAPAGHSIFRPKLRRWSTGGRSSGRSIISGASAAGRSVSGNCGSGTASVKDTERGRQRAVVLGAAHITRSTRDTRVGWRSVVGYFHRACIDAS